MSDFLGERGRDLFTGKPVKSKVTSHKHAKNVWDIIDQKLEKRRAPVAAPPRSKATRKPRPKSEDTLAQTLRDFRNGLDAVKAAVDKLGSKERPRSTPDVRRPGMPPPSYRREPATPVQKILEREMRILTRVTEKIPTPARHVPPTPLRSAVATSFKSAAEQALREGTPQLFARLVHAARATRAAPSSVVLRPSKGSPVQSLMKVARAIRAGRLPFVPQETKRRAQELLNAVKGHRGATPAPAALHRLIERHRLIPLAVQHDLRTIKQPSNTQREMGRAVTQRMRLTEAEARKLSASIPRFDTEGAMVGGGPAITDLGESRTRVGEADVIQGAESQYTQGYEAPASPDHGGERVAGENSPPGSPQHKAPASAATDESKTSGGLGGKTGGGTVGAGGSGPTRITGELTIAGLAQWIAKIEGEMKGA